LTQNDRGARVIFFCQCRYPRCDSRTCHRVEIALLLLRAARRRNVKLTIVEWPGGTPRSLSHDRTDEAAEKNNTWKQEFALGRKTAFCRAAWITLGVYRAPALSASLSARAG
jgi:hypothetical protein